MSDELYPTFYSVGAKLHFHLLSSASKYLKFTTSQKPVSFPASDFLLGLEQVHFLSCGCNPQMLLGLTLSSPSPSTFSSSIPLEDCWRAWLRPFLAFFSSCLSWKSSFLSGRYPVPQGSIVMESC